MINKCQNIPKDTAWINISNSWNTFRRRSTLFSKQQNWSHKTSFFAALDQ